MFHNNTVVKKLSSLSFRKKKNTPDRSNGDQYFYITNFEQTSEKECLEFDKLNEQIYYNNLKLFNDTNKKLANTPFKLMENPHPPSRPNNYERLYLWRQRNIKLSVHDQSLAIVYLLSKGINIKFPDSKDDGIEPFEAIKVAETIALEKSENMMRVVIDYLTSLNLNNIEAVVKNKECNIERLPRNEQMSQQFHDDHMRCSNPEHHSIKKKVDFYDSRNRSQSLNSLYPSLEEDGYNFQRSNSIASVPTHVNSMVMPSAPPEYNQKF